jgi:deazaflavin-dependent oxidoreductase (nitroreductase family)
MPLMDSLGYEVTPQSGFRRRFVELATNEPVSRLIARSAMPLDRLMLRGTAGRMTATSVMTGLPVLWLTTRGAKSGQSRVVPLLGIPTPSRNLAVLGTNFGGDKTPAWVHNLVAHPEALAEWRDRSADVIAHQLEPREQDPVWETAIAAYPTYANYRTNAAHRTIRVFELGESEDR